MSPWLLEVAGFVIVIIVGIYFGRVHGPWRRSPEPGGRDCVLLGHLGGVVHRRYPGRVGNLPCPGPIVLGPDRVHEGRFLVRPPGRQYYQLRLRLIHQQTGIRIRGRQSRHKRGRALRGLPGEIGRTTT